MKIHRWPLLVVIFLTLLTWYKVSNQSLMGEGLSYFNYGFLNGGIGKIPALLAFDTSAMLLFDVLSLVFADNIRSYMLFMLAIAVLLNVSYYFLVYELTEKKIIAFLAAVFFTVNHLSSYETYGIGFYQFFAQRQLVFPLVFLTMILFARFVKNQVGRRDYVISIFLFCLATLLTQFTMVFLPLFMVYPIALWLEKRKGWQDLWPRLFMGLPFVLGSWILLWLDRHFGKPVISPDPIYQFILQTPRLIEKMAYQFSWAVVPLPILQELIDPNIRENMLSLAIPAAILFLMAIFYLFKREAKSRAIVLTSVVFLLASIFLNLYTRASQVEYIYIGGSRYLYYPAFAFSILLAVTLYSFLYRGGLIKKLFLIFLTCWWIFFNVKTTWKSMDDAQPLHTAAIKTFDYVKTAKYPNGAFVLLPEIVDLYGGSFCQKFYGRGSIRFVPIYTDWEQWLPENFDLNKLFAIDYDYTKTTIVRRDEEFRGLLRAGKLGQELKAAKLKYKER